MEKSPHALGNIFVSRDKDSNIRSVVLTIDSLAIPVGKNKTITATIYNNKEGTAPTVVLSISKDFTEL